MSGKLNMECHIATVFCEFEMTVSGTVLPGGSGVLFLPKHYDATITEVTIENLNRDSMYTTLLVPKDQGERHAAKMKNEGFLKNKTPTLIQNYSCFRSQQCSQEIPTKS